MRRSALFFFVLVLGAIALGGGLYLGLTSHQVTYKRVGRGIIAHYLTGQGTGYLQMANSPTLYTVNESSFMPKIDGTNTLLNGDTISFIYDSSTTTYIDQQSVLKTHLSGNAYRIVQLTFYDTNTQTVFTTSEYVQYPEGHYQNNWLPFGAPLLVVGMLMVSGSFFLPRKKTGKAEPVRTMGEHIGVVPLPEEEEQASDEVGMFEAEDEEDEVQITSSIPYISLPLAVPRLPDQSTGQFKAPPSSSFAKNWSTEHPAQPTGQFKAPPSSFGKNWSTEHPAQPGGTVETGKEDVQITSSVPYIKLPLAAPRPTAPRFPAVEADEESDVQITNSVPYIRLPLAAPRPSDPPPEETQR